MLFAKPSPAGVGELQLVRLLDLVVSDAPAYPEHVEVVERLEALQVGTDLIEVAALEAQQSELDQHKELEPDGGLGDAQRLRQHGNWRH